MTDRWRHKKRGTMYEVLTQTAQLQCATAQEIEDQFADQQWTVYRSTANGEIYLRPTAEFMDGRFERVAVEAPELFARAGERVTCENGHLIATFKRDVMRGEVSEVEALAWDIPKPKTGEPAGNCPTCGAPWNAVQVDGDGVLVHSRAQLHIEGEWRW